MNHYASYRRSRAAQKGAVTRARNAAERVRAAQRTRVRAFAALLAGCGSAEEAAALVAREGLAAPDFIELDEHPGAYPGKQGCYPDGFCYLRQARNRGLLWEDGKWIGGGDA